MISGAGGEERELRRGEVGERSGVENFIAGAASLFEDKLVRLQLVSQGKKPVPSSKKKAGLGFMPRRGTVGVGMVLSTIGGDT